MNNLTTPRLKEAHLVTLDRDHVEDIKKLVPIQTQSLPKQTSLLKHRILSNSKTTRRSNLRSLPRKTIISTIEAATNPRAKEVKTKRRPTNLDKAPSTKLELTQLEP